MLAMKEIFHNKLVRDKIPLIIQQEGKEPVTKQIADDEEFLKLLVEKLLEETKEFQTTYNHEELADIFEVLDAILKVLELPIRHITYLRNLKNGERGGFEERQYLISVRD